MIPKIIHYCWFGKGLMPHSQKKCIEGWKKLMPDYTIMRWDESTFDLDKYPLARYACEVKKYALASDVCRYNVLAEYGGIYLDTDVEVYKRFDEFLGNNFFTGIELYNEFYTEHIQERFLNEDGTAKDPTQDVPRMEVLTSSIGAAKGLKMICDLRDYYNSAEATPERALHYRDWVNNDRLVARYLTQYGYRYKNETQHFGDGMVVYGTGTFGHAFCPDQRFSVSYHYNAATWESERWNKSQRIAMFFDKVGLLPIYKNYKKIKKKIKRHLLIPAQGEIWCLHRVVVERSPYPTNRELEITPNYLETLIREYKRKGYKFVSLDDIVSSIRGKRQYDMAKRCAITFDDGFKDIYEVVFPIFKREQIPFTIYLTTGMPDGTACLWWEQMASLGLSIAEFEQMVKDIYGSPENMTEVFLNRFGVKPDLELTRSLSLSWEQLREMVDSGLCSIGSHTVDHFGLSRLPQDQVRRDLFESKQRIESQLQVPVRHFSYPHSMANAEVISLVKECGYQSATMGYGGKVRWGDNPYSLNRKYIVEKN